MKIKKAIIDRRRVIMVYEKKSKISCEEVFNKADNFFEQELGLKRDKKEDCSSYTGGGGHVKISCCKEDNKSVVEIETREWDRMVKKFLKKI